MESTTSRSELPPGKTTKASTRRRRFERAPEAEHSLTPQKMEVLALIASVRFLSTPQVAAAIGPSDNAVRRHLRDLFDMGLLDVQAVPGSAVGSAALIAAKVHRPTAAGLKTLERSGMLTEGAAKSRAKESAYLGHELAVRDVFAWLAAAARTTSDHSLERFECVHVPPCFDANPDAAFAYRFAEGKVVAGMLEADTGSERALSGATDRWGRKIEAYSSAFSEESRDTVREVTGYKRARLVVTVPSAQRAQWIRRRAEGSIVSGFLWIAVRSELMEAALTDPVWLAPGGRRGFLEVEK